MTKLPPSAMSRRYFCMFGARRFTFLMMLLPWTVCISESCRLVRFEVRRRRWLLPPLVRISLPVPVRRNRLEVALWVLSFILPPFFALRGTATFSFQKNSPRAPDVLPRISRYLRGDLLYAGASPDFWGWA